MSIKKSLLRLPLIFALLCLLWPIYSSADNKQRNIIDFEQRIINLVKTSDQLSLSTIGTVKHGDFISPIWLIKYKGSDKSKMKVFISGGIHGDEPAGPESVLASISEVANHPDKYKHVNIDFIPLINPSGWVNGTRLNAEGEDINRDFNLLISQESIIVNNYLNSRVRYKLMIDHHEDPRYKGFYIVSYDNKQISIIKDAINQLKNKGYPLREFKKNDGWFSVSKKLTPNLKDKTFMSYARGLYSKRVYQVESPTTPDMKDRTTMHALVDDILIYNL